MSVPASHSVSPAKVIISSLLQHLPFLTPPRLRQITVRNDKKMTSRCGLKVVPSRFTLVFLSVLMKMTTVRAYVCPATLVPTFPYRTHLKSTPKQKEPQLSTPTADVESTSSDSNRRTSTTNPRGELETATPPGNPVSHTTNPKGPQKLS